MSKRLVLFSLSLLLVSSLTASWYFSKQFSRNNTVQELQFEEPVYNPVIRAAVQNLSDVNFINASKISTPTVVFIKTESQVQQRSSFWFFDFDPFGSIGKVSSTGSGVIISADGYIVTNHHVIQNAEKIEVVIGGKRSYTAQVIGNAPSSDLALLKIDAKNLPFIEVANSDEVEIGEWVLAVGNPFNLNSTVTAGIVSAKGRNINIVQNEFPIESFIQTDAAINPGNSGGALVNLQGKLIGVNTAIASKTGSYIGYGFAIPSNIVLKIVNDLREYGEIQRGFDGLDVTELSQTSPNFERYNGSGVEVKRVTGLNESLSSSIQTGDVILAMNGKKIDGLSDYNEALARHRPGDEIKYTLGRDGKDIEKTVTLVNQDGGKGRFVRRATHSTSLGADFEPITKLEKERYGITEGFRISGIVQGRVRSMNIPEGFVLTAVNRVVPESVEEAISLLENSRGQLRIEGVSPNGGKQVMSFYMY